MRALPAPDGELIHLHPAIAGQSETEVFMLLSNAGVTLTAP